MSDLPAAQRHALESWAQQAVRAGWLPEKASASLQEIPVASPEQLFESGNRPLVAGFFGGTGVGKSSLLNRLAGEPVAKASAERPTSRHITVYLHSSMAIDKLPEHFPMQRMQTAQHNNEHFGNVLFIDMPDFDSVETANRELVDLWLPHLDVVLYVVSPDRYRDDQGWQLLLKHVHQHAWLFVMNHWDRGEVAQLDDFKAQLAAAGLSEPLVFCTDCSMRSSHARDEFDALQSSLIQASDRATVVALNEHGILTRLKALKTISDPWLKPLGSDELHSRLADNWLDHWRAGNTDLKDSLSYKARLTAQHYAETQGNWLTRMLGRNAAQSAPVAPPTLIDAVWLERLDNTVSDFINQQSLSRHAPLAAMQQVIAEPYARARQDIAPLVTEALGTSIALPGRPWQRNLYKTLGWLCFLLPLSAMGWIGWRIVNAFIEGGSNPAAYLGGEFVVNGTLLVLMAWLLPTFAHYKVRPSREQAALRGINAGLDSALLATEVAIEGGFHNMKESAKNLRRKYDALWTSLTDTDTGHMPEPVRRMLASELTQPRMRSLDVRANTQSSTESTPLS